jgi:hypothetical protein
MNGIQVLDRPASQKFYAVAGRLLFVQSSDLSLAARIEQLFSGWQLTPVPFPEPNPDIKISFSISDGLPVVRGVSEFERLSESGPLTEFEISEGGHCYTHAEGFDLVFENSLLELRGNNPIDVSVWIRKIPYPSDAELARVTSFAVCAALRRFGIFELHSAAVVIPNTETGVLIIGQSGSGKSTLTSQLARAGWSYLSDDEVLLSLNGNEVEARGFRSFFALAPATTANSGTKQCFEPESVFSAPRVNQAAPRFLLFTSLSGMNETQHRELSQAETMSRLIRACPWASYDTLVAGPYLDILSRLARQTKGINLLAGTDLLDAREASRIISSICHE